MFLRHYLVNQIFLVRWIDQTLPIGSFAMLQIIMGLRLDHHPRLSVPCKSTTIPTLACLSSLVVWTLSRCLLCCTRLPMVTCSLTSPRPFPQSRTSRSPHPIRSHSKTTPSSTRSSTPGIHSTKKRTQRVSGANYHLK